MSEVVVVWAIEKSVLEQVLSRNELARDEVDHWVCCLLVVPHLARLSRLCRGRPRPCLSRLPARRAAFVFFLSKYCSDLKGIFIRKDTCQSESNTRNNSVAKQVDLAVCISGQRFESRTGALSVYLYFSCAVFIQVCIHTAAIAALCVAILLLQLLLAAADRHRVPVSKIGYWFIESDSSVFFPFTRHFNVPLGCIVVFTASIACILGNYGHARSQGGRQPAAAKQPLYVI